MKLARASALLSLAAVLAACAPRVEAPKREREVVSLPPNTEITGKYWITCKAGFTTARGVEGCVPFAKSGENPTTVVEIPNSSGRWGADSRDRERKGSRGACCADHGGSLGCLGGVAVCADGSVGQGCDCGEDGLGGIEGFGGLDGLEGLFPSE